MNWSRVLLTPCAHCASSCSAPARGDMGKDSDLDVAVVMPDGTDSHQIAEILYPRMIGMGIAVDLLITTPEQMQAHQSSRGMVYRDVWRDGKELYAA